MSRSPEGAEAEGGEAEAEAEGEAEGAEGPSATPAAGPPAGIWTARPGGLIRDPAFAGRCAIMAERFGMAATLGL